MTWSKKKQKIESELCTRYVCCNRNIICFACAQIKEKKQKEYAAMQ